MHADVNECQTWFPLSRKTLAADTRGLVCHDVPIRTQNIKPGIFFFCFFSFFFFFRFSFFIFFFFFFSFFRMRPRDRRVVGSCGTKKAAPRHPGQQPSSRQTTRPKLIPRLCRIIIPLTIGGRSIWALGCRHMSVIRPHSPLHFPKRPAPSCGGMDKQASRFDVPKNRHISAR